MSRRLRRLPRRAVRYRYRFGHTQGFAANGVYCRARRISGQDAYHRRRSAHGFAG